MTKLFLLFLTVITLCASPAMAANYYVATDGSDSDPGTLAEPWLTLTYASTQVSSGDTVYIRGGIYSAAYIIDVGGTAQNYITFTNYQNEEVIIEGCDEVTGWSNHSGNIYKATWNSSSLNSIPLQGSLAGSVGFVDVDKVIDEDHWLQPVETVNDMVAGTWYYDKDEDLLYVWLMDSSDPSSHEIWSTLSWASSTGIILVRVTYMRFENITIRLAAFGIETVYGNESHNLIFDNITIYGTRQGFVTQQPSHDITFQNSEVYLSQGPTMQINGDYTIIQNNKIHDSGFVDWYYWGASGLTVPGNYNTITENEIYDTGTTGIFLENWATGEPSQEMGHHNTVKHNYIHHSNPGSKSGIVFSGQDYSLAHNNIIYNYGIGIAIVTGGANQTADQKIAKYDKIYNNTIVGCDERGVSVDGSGLIENAEIKNNIFYENQIEIYVSSVDLMDDFNSDNNLFKLSDGYGFRITWPGDDISSLADWKTKSSEGANSIQADPLFKDIGNLDFSLKSTSPGIDKGQIIAGLEYVGIAPDIGAFEVPVLESPKNFRVAQF